MAGTIGTISPLPIGGSFGDVNRVAIPWTADGSGNVNGTRTPRLGGTIVRVVLAPGTPAPTNSYVAKLLDQAGVDVLAGKGATPSNSATVPYSFNPATTMSDGTNTGLSPMAVLDTFELQITGAGANGQGSVILYFR